MHRTAATDAAARERAQREYVPIASTAVTVGAALIAIILIAHHFGHDVSSLVIFLLSESSSYITGVEHVIDGGASLS